MSIIPFNEKQKFDSFIELQNHILECQNNNTNFVQCLNQL